MVILSKIKIQTCAGTGLYFWLTVIFFAGYFETKRFQAILIGPNAYAIASDIWSKNQNIFFIHQAVTSFSRRFLLTFSSKAWYNKYAILLQPRQRCRKICVAAQIKRQITYWWSAFLCFKLKLSFEYYIKHIV